MSECPFCLNPIANGWEIAQLSEEGVKSILRAASDRGVDDPQVCVNVWIHNSCRREFVSQKNIRACHKRKNDARDLDAQPKRRSQMPAFDFQMRCFLCTQEGQLDDGKEYRNKYPDRVWTLCYPVRTSSFQTLIMQACEERNDEWGTSVKGRVEFAQDLHAADAMYHQSCSVNFRTRKNIPIRYQTNERIQERGKRGRPKDTERERAFAIVVEDFICTGEQKSITQLVEDMSKLCDDPYSTKYMKQKLIETLGQNIIVSDLCGASDILTFNQTAAEILQKFYAEPKDANVEAEKHRFVETAAALIRSQIIGEFASQTKDIYPTATDLKSLDKMRAYVPQLLSVFLQDLIVSADKDLKIAALGQCLVQAVRPRAVLAPIPFGLAVQLHHLYGSRNLIDTLHKYGFCSSYNEVQTYEVNSATQMQETSMVPGPVDLLQTDNAAMANLSHTEKPMEVVSADNEPPELQIERGTCIDSSEKKSSTARKLLSQLNGHFRQFVGDNADRNPWSLDGRKSLHAMGLLEAITPEAETELIIKRDTNISHRLHLRSLIAIKTYSYPNKDNPLIYNDLGTLRCTNDTARKVDILWRVAWPLKCDRPQWSGSMYAITKGVHLGKSSINYLPMIDMDPTNLTCIFSTLSFISKECMKNSCTPVITFDQPLWWKSRVIINNEPISSYLKQIVLDLGGFHTILNFLSSIGHLMECSGLKDVLEVIYGANAVTHMLHGKSYSRAIRGHFVVDSALNAVITSDAYNLPLCSVGDYAIHDDLTEMAGIFERLLEGMLTVDEATSFDVVERVAIKLQEHRRTSYSHKTGQLWKQYISMVDLLRDFLRAERTGDWNMRLSVLDEMKKYFAATGHRNYAKCVQIFLQDMVELKSKNQLIYSLFETGMFVIRRSDKFWGGLSKDLIIEQCLMRSLKSVGGLVHGRGIMSEIQRNKWLLSLPVCASINDAMRVLSDSKHSEEKHKELSNSRIRRDNEDANQVLGYIREHNPFEGCDELRNVVTGEAADGTVNCNQAYEIGERIFQQMYGQDALKGYTFRKKNEVVTMGQSKITVDDEPVFVDPQLLFQRLIAIGNARADIDDTKDLLEYELTNHPPALFDDHGFLR